MSDKIDVEIDIGGYDQEEDDEPQDNANPSGANEEAKNHSMNQILPGS